MGKKSAEDPAPITTGNWQIQTAKARFSEVFRLARNQDPQRITLQGKEAVVMISNEKYEELVGRSRQPKSLVQFFRQSPLAGVELDLERSRDRERDIEL
jgi:prevent-host-death family protein